MTYAAANFGDGRAQTLGAVTGTSTGTLVTASATVNTKGAWVSLGTPSFPFDSLSVFLGGSSAAADYVVDLGIDDGAGNVFAVAEDLRLGALKGAADLFLNYQLPLRLPNGVPVSARCACSTASGTLRALVVGTSAGPLSAGGFSRCIALYTPATSRGVTIDSGATANTKPATWTQTQAATSHEVDAIMIGIGPNADVTRTTATTGLLDIGVGASGSEFALASNLLWGFTTTSDTPFPNVVGPLPLGIPAGSRVSARMQSTNATAGDRTVDLAVWGFVA